MGVPVRDHSLQFVNDSESVLSESDFGIRHPYWHDVPDIPAEAYRAMGVLGVLTNIFAFSGNVAVPILMYR